MSTAMAIAFGAIAIVSAISSEGLRQRVIVPAIENGSSYAVGVSVFTLFVEAREYRAHCLAHGASLRWWRAWWISNTVFFASLVGSVVSYLASMA